MVFGYWETIIAAVLTEIYVYLKEISILFCITTYADIRALSSVDTSFWSDPDILTVTLSPLSQSFCCQVLQNVPGFMETWLELICDQGSCAARVSVNVTLTP